MFNKNKDFYPTPEHVILSMGIDCADKIVLEPHGGKGDIIDWLKQNGAKQVLTCEKDENLAEIVKTKAKFIKHNFLKVTQQEISHVDLIVMNPPFSNGVKHLLHAWYAAPDGCEIISLLNNASIENNHTNERNEVKRLIRDYGVSTNLGNVFNFAERKTHTTEIALIKLFKPKSDNETEFKGFFMEEDEELPQGNGIMRYDFIRDVVQRYVGAVQCFEEHLEVSEKMNSLVNLFGVGSFSFEIGYKNDVVTKEDFKKELQKKAWAFLFSKMNLNKYLTTRVMEDINKFAEKQNNIPFTMKNIYHMFQVIFGTSQSNFQKALVEAIDNFTKHNFENRYNVEGWKTNEGHMLNEKIIIPNIVSVSYNGNLSDTHGRYSDDLKDLIKVLCSITATDYNTIISLDRMLRYQYKLFDGDKFIEQIDEYKWGFCDKFEEIEQRQKDALKKGIKCEIREEKCQTGKWYDWHFFMIKGFKKGTIHLKFKDPKVWERLNRAYAEAKGQVLPEKFRV